MAACCSPRLAREVALRLPHASWALHSMLCRVGAYLPRSPQQMPCAWGPCVRVGRVIPTASGEPGRDRHLLPASHGLLPAMGCSHAAQAVQQQQVNAAFRQASKHKPEALKGEAGGTRHRSIDTGWIRYQNASVRDSWLAVVPFPVVLRKRPAVFFTFNRTAPLTACRPLFPNKVCPVSTKRPQDGRAAGSAVHI